MPVEIYLDIYLTGVLTQGQLEAAVRQVMPAVKICFRKTWEDTGWRNDCPVTVVASFEGGPLPERTGELSAERSPPPMWQGNQILLMPVQLEIFLPGAATPVEQSAIEVEVTRRLSISAGCETACDGGYLNIGQKPQEYVYHSDNYDNAELVCRNGEFLLGSSEFVDWVDGWRPVLVLDKVDLVPAEGNRWVAAVLDGVGRRYVDEFLCGLDPGIQASAALGLLERVRDFIRNDPASVASTYPGGSTPLHFASGEGQTQIVQELLAHGAEVDAVDCEGCTPFFRAAHLNHVDAARLLCEHGANVNAANAEGKTAEWSAARQRHHEILALIRAYS